MVSVGVSEQLKRRHYRQMFILARRMPLWSYVTLRDRHLLSITIQRIS